MKRNTQVGQYAVHLLYTVISQEIFQIFEITAYKSETGVIDNITLGILILVKRIEMPATAQTAQNFTRMPAAAKGHVDINAIGLYREPLHRFVEQRRYVIYRLLCNIIYHNAATCISGVKIEKNRRYAETQTKDFSQIFRPKSIYIKIHLLKNISETIHHKFYSANSIHSSPACRFLYSLGVVSYILANSR